MSKVLVFATGARRVYSVSWHHPAIGSLIDPSQSQNVMSLDLTILQVSGYQTL